MAAPHGKDHNVHRAEITALQECVWKRVDRPSWREKSPSLRQEDCLLMEGYREQSPCTTGSTSRLMGSITAVVSVGSTRWGDPPEFAPSASRLALRPSPGVSRSSVPATLPVSRASPSLCVGLDASHFVVAEWLVESAILRECRVPCGDGESSRSSAVEPDRQASRVACCPNT